MKFSQAISQVKWLSGEQTNVSKTISVLVLRVLVWQWLGRTFWPNIYIPGQDCLRDWSMGGFNGHFAWIMVVCEQQLGYQVPGPAKCEAITSVHVVLVESYLDGFLDEAVHVSRCSVQHWDVVEINLMSGVYAVFCNRRFLWLIESYVSQ
jgi:hypothetical protein